jgi:two-component system response regulator FlrC
MYSSTATKRLLGIADTAWPESAPIEQLAMALGFEAVVSTQVEGLARQKDLGVVVTKLQPGSSLQSMIESMRSFGEDVQFVIRADASDLQTVTTLARIPGVHVVGDSDFNESTWKPIFNAQLLANSVKDETSKVEPVAPQEQSLDYIFVDPKSQHLLALIERLAVTKAAVLLQGATGSGKEVLARTLHELSDRSNKPFIALNCAAMPEHLVEDMLFGHEKGAFTGATRELAGVFEQAQGGTVFLDEIGEMPIQLQAKLLRVLQEKEVVRLGGRDSIALDFRLVAATNKDLKAGIADKTFREDLYYRISAFKLQVPTLAERRGDIVPLAN